MEVKNSAAQVLNLNIVDDLSIPVFAAPRSFLLYSRRSDVSRMVVSQQDSPDMVLALHSLHRLRAIDYDPIKQHVYWIDGRTRAIKRALENGTKVCSITETILNW